MTVLPIHLYQTTNYLGEQNATVRLKKSDFENVTFNGDKITLYFSNCIFGSLHIENLEDITFPQIFIEFHNCYIGLLHVQEIVSKNISISFLESMLTGRIENENLYSIVITNCLLLNDLLLTKVNRVNIHFLDDFSNHKKWKLLLIRLQISLADDLFLVANRYFISDCKNVRFTAVKYIPNKDERPKLSLNLKYSEEAKHVQTIVNGVFLESFEISGEPSGEVYIENLNINSWYIYNLRPKGELSFHNIASIKDGEAGKKIAIHRCNLDNVTFDTIAFNDYPIVSFYKSKFSKARFTSCDFPDSYKNFGFVEVENVHYPDKIPRNQDKAIYEIFLQLKKSFEDSGNYYEAQKIQAISHDALKRVKGISWWDRKILSINSLSNDHGLSIKKPFFGFLGFSIIFYLAYLLSLGRLFKSTDFDPTLIGYYFSFIDLTHRLDFLVKQDQYTGWSLFLDAFSKIAIGFFIFQFISAFRKYGKNK